MSAMADFKYKKSYEFTESHRSYRPPKPAANKLIARKYDAAAYEAHRARLSRVKPSIDNKPPKQHMHLQVKLKKIQLEEERAAQIEHDNRLLLSKMAKILRTRGAIDNRNTAEFKSLDRNRRQRELVRIARENQAMLKRIQSRKPNITAAGLEADFEKHLILGNRLSAHPDPDLEASISPRRSPSSRRHSGGNSTQESHRSPTPNSEEDAQSTRSDSPTPSEDHKRSPSPTKDDQRSPTPNQDKDDEKANDADAEKAEVTSEHQPQEENK